MEHSRQKRNVRTQTKRSLKKQDVRLKNRTFEPKLERSVEKRNVHFKNWTFKTKTKNSTHFTLVANTWFRIFLIHNMILVFFILTYNYINHFWKSLHDTNLDYSSRPISSLMSLRNEGILCVIIIHSINYNSWHY